MLDNKQIETLLSTLYHSLRTERRRYIIQILKQEDNRKFTTRQLARKVTSREQGVSKQRATGEPYRNVYNAISQTHLPTLSEAGIIIYDPHRQTVTRGVYFDLAALLLDTNSPTARVFVSYLCEESDSETDNHNGS